MKTTIYGATIVNEGRTFKGGISIENGRIAEILEDTKAMPGHHDTAINATGCFLLPGVIDEHVHFREPGLTSKADMESESRAAAAGGVTTFFDMPNTLPQTVTLEALEEKFKLAAQKSHINYSFFFGATHENTALFRHLDHHRLPGIKLFMGSSTGNMLVEKSEHLHQIFRDANLPIMTHCEDTGLINRNAAIFQQQYGEDPDVVHHPMIRSEEACLRSTQQAVALARQYGTRLHVAHVTTEKELQLFGEHPHITAEAVIAHLLFTDCDYLTLGTRIKCNPAVKQATDRNALLHALNNGKISAVATDHAPHLLADKQGGCIKAASGMPMIQFSLVAMLGLVDQGFLTIERVAELMCHQPARIFEVRERGFLRKGYHADLTIVRPGCAWQVTDDSILSRCKWSPLEGRTLNWKVEHTFCNGHHIYSNGIFDDRHLGQEVIFR